MDCQNNTKVVDFSSFEGSKENIQPLKRGRNPRALKAAFEHLDLRDGHLRLKEVLIAEREQYEAAIRDYTGDNPLVLWIRYIRWTQNAYPAGGSQSHLLPLLEKCTRQFKDDDRYRQNIRYLRCWLLYANLVRQPDDIFSFLQHNGIGVTFALFYQSWASILVERKQYDKADAIVSKGIAIRAQPLDDLKKMLDRIQLRVMSNIRMQMTSNPMRFFESDTEEDEPMSRPPLCRINKRRERLRDENSGLRHQTTLTSRQRNTQGNSQLSVFRDNPNSTGIRNSGISDVNSSGSGIPLKIWNDYGSEAMREKENRGIATPWNTGPLYPPSGRTEEEKNRRQDRRERRRAKEMRKRKENSFTVFCDTPQVQTPATNYSRNLHNIEASHIPENVSTTERKLLSTPALAVQHEEKKEGVLTDNPLQYMKDEK